MYRPSLHQTEVRREKKKGIDRWEKEINEGKKSKVKERTGSVGYERQWNDREGIESRKKNRIHVSERWKKKLDYMNERMNEEIVKKTPIYSNQSIKWESK